MLKFADFAGCDNLEKIYEKPLKEIVCTIIPVVLPVLPMPSCASFPGTLSHPRHLPKYPSFKHLLTVFNFKSNFGPIEFLSQPNHKLNLTQLQPELG